MQKKTVLHLYRPTHIHNINNQEANPQHKQRPDYTGSTWACKRRLYLHTHRPIHSINNPHTNWQHKQRLHYTGSTWAWKRRLYYKYYIYIPCGHDINNLYYKYYIYIPCGHDINNPETNSQHEERPDNRGSSHVAEEEAGVHEGQQTVACLQCISHVSNGLFIKSGWVLWLQA